MLVSGLEPDYRLIKLLVDKRGYKNIKHKKGSKRRR